MKIKIKLYPELKDLHHLKVINELIPEMNYNMQNEEESKVRKKNNRNKQERD